jgi:hypothetical protein
LRKARELREQATKDEQEIHSTLTKKKEQQNQHTDELIAHVITSDVQSTFQRLKEKQLSMDTLEKMIDRLDDRHARALGYEHVTLGEKETFQRVTSQKDEMEVERLNQMVDILLGAVQILDDEFQQAHSKKSTGGVAGDSEGSMLYSVSHAEASHWGGGRAAQHLRQKLQEKRRERDEQFLNRQAEINEAQRVKKKHTEKVKDDHGFLP